MIFVYHQREFLLLVFQSFLCGVCLGAIYDVFRISRLISGISEPQGIGCRLLCEKEYPLIGKPGQRKLIGKRAADVILFFEDILFMLIAAVLLTVLLFFRNDGKFRLIVILLAAFGFLCYYVSFGRLVIRFSSLIVFALRIVTAYAVFALLFPIRMIVRVLKSALSAVLRCLYVTYARARIRSLSKKKTEETLAASLRGFILTADEGEKRNKREKAKTKNDHRKNGGIKNVGDKAEKKI